MKQRLVIVASTFPRWPNDSVPPFVLQHAEAMRPHFESIQVLAPHYKGSKKIESLNNINVKRFRYFWPASGENIVYDGGGANKVSKNPLYMLKLLMFILSEFFVLLRIVRKNHDIINAHWLVPQGVVAVLVGSLTRTPVVITIHGSDIFTLNSWLMRHVKAYALKRADCVVTNSVATKKACQAVFPGREYHIIPPGIQPERLIEPKRRKKGDFLIVATGRLSPEKGFIYLCEAMSIFIKKHPHASLKIIGEGPERGVLEDYIKTHKLGANIELMGWKLQKEMSAIYADANVFAGPSINYNDEHSEGFGLVFAEASAASLPVIATNIGGIKDVVKDNETGLLIKQKSAAAIVGALERLYSQPGLAKKLGSSGRNFVETTLTWSVIAKRYKQLFSDL